MKVLLLSITAGQGHNATAKAIGDYLTGMGIDNTMLDTYQYLSKALGETVSKGYLLTVKHAKTPYSATYRLLELRQKNANMLSATRLANMLWVKKMKKFIDAYKPDVIVCTHIFSCIIIDIMKAAGMLTAKTVGIITDFTVHPFWEEALHFDRVVTADRSLDYRMMQKGFRAEQILPIGIPIHPKFNNMAVEKKEARTMLELDPDKPVLLLMGGSMGYGRIDKTVKMLDELDLDYQIAVVCGSNQEAFKRVEKLKTKNRVLNFGFTDKVDLLMDAADCIVTKPGGLTTSEALAKRLPMIIINPIPGQEDRNTEFLLNSGAAVSVSKTFPLDEAVYSLFSCPERFDAMLPAIDLIRKPDSTKRLCECIRDLAEEI
ncbi:MAG: glycosyltransferase [Ruminococcaceae bacterium]|nr:glycosyltransferase [Oscillospiraceae bacterium]